MMAGVDELLDASNDGIDMDVPAQVIAGETKYTGAIFHVDDLLVRLTRKDGGHVDVRRQVLRHPECVVMLVHDVATDRYLMEREYRAGSDMFAHGIPAGLMDDGEDVMTAAWRELREETGIVPDLDADGAPRAKVDRVGAFYSSEGMADELANVMVIHLESWHEESRHFDPDEHVESAWVSWEQMLGVGIQASNSVIAIQHEQLRRLGERLRAQDGSQTDASID